MSAPCIACGTTDEWATRAMGADGFCSGCLDSEGSTSGMSPAEFFEAGRLAAVRADVADFVGWCEREAARYDGDADAWSAAWQYRSEAQWARGKADSLRVKAADCRRWLEVTS